MPFVNTCEELTDSQNLFGVNCDIRSLSRSPTGWLYPMCLATETPVIRGQHTMDHDARIGEAMSFPLFTCAGDARVSIASRAQSCVEHEPAARRRDPMDAAWPTQYVCIGDETY